MVAEVMVTVPPEVMLVEFRLMSEPEVPTDRPVTMSVPPEA